MIAYLYNMVLSYKELRKRDVVNIADGRSFGKITDLKLEFPKATLKGIVVCERKKGGILWFFCKNEIFIDEKQIVRIGGDVILVNIDHCAVTTPQVVEINSKSEKYQNGNNKPPYPPCPKPPLPPVPPDCPPDYPLPPNDNGKYFGEDATVDFDDY